MLRNVLWVASISLATVSILPAQTAPPTAPQNAAPSSGTLADGWEQIDQRMLFLTVQLSSVETSLAAVNRAILSSSHAQTAKRGEVDQHLKGNELMDRNAGGPVSWEKFYGKTAEHFFYHPKGRNEIYINPRATPQRPPQLDYIYRANSQAAARADADVAALGTQVQVLTNRRRELETQQEQLWAKISFQALATREIGDKPIYRFAPAAATTDALAAQEADAIGAISRFVLTADRAAAAATPRMEAQPADTFSKLSATIVESRHALNETLVRLPLLATQAADANSDLGRATAVSKRLVEFAQNITDAHNAAAEADKALDETGKNTMRATLQQSLMGYADSVLELDRAAGALSTAWHVTPDVKREVAPVTIAWASGAAHAALSAAVAPGAEPVAPMVVAGNQRELTIEATHNALNAVTTDIVLTKGQTFTLTPNAGDRWAKGTGSKRGKHVNYQGYTGEAPKEDIRKGANWLALRWRIGATSEPVQSGVAITAPESGRLELFCNDDKPEKNTGAMHVTVTLP